MRPMRIIKRLVPGCLVAVSGVLLAQHATEGDISDGERAYANSCASCHGPDGDLIDGIHLGRGLFRRDYSDAELIGIIMNGIADTPMPATPAMTEAQAERIVQYLRDRAASRRVELFDGDAVRGEQLVLESSDCLDCHTVNGVGARHGPDLSRIGLELGSTELEAALLQPAASVRPTNRSYRVVLATGEEVTGRLLNHDTFTVQLVDTAEQLRSFTKSTLRDHGFIPSAMPAYADSFSQQDLADVVSYLSSLQGAVDE